MLKRILITVSIVMVVACGKVENTTKKIDTVSSIQVHDVNEYRDQSNLLVNKSRALLQKQELEESDLVVVIRDLEALIKAASVLDIPDDKTMKPELTSTLGSLYARRAAYYPKDPIQAATFASKGFRYLDEAVDAYPDNITARLNRGIVSLHSPEFLNKFSVAKTDFEHVRNGASYASLDEVTQKMVDGLLHEANEKLTEKN